MSRNLVIGTIWTDFKAVSANGLERHEIGYEGTIMEPQSREAIQLNDLAEPYRAMLAKAIKDASK